MPVFADNVTVTSEHAQTGSLSPPNGVCTVYTCAMGATRRQPVLKRPEYQDDHLPHCTAEIKNEMNYISRPSLRAKKELTLPEYTTHTEIKFEVISRVKSTFLK